MFCFHFKDSVMNKPNEIQNKLIYRRKQFSRLPIILDKSIMLKNIILQAVSGHCLAELRITTLTGYVNGLRGKITDSCRVSSGLGKVHGQYQVVIRLRSMNVWLRARSGAGCFLNPESVKEGTSLVMKPDKTSMHLGTTQKLITWSIEEEKKLAKSDFHYSNLKMLENLLESQHNEANFKDVYNHFVPSL